MLLAIDNRTAARSILARAATANTPGPLRRSCTPAFVPVAKSAAAARKLRPNRLDRFALGVAVGAAAAVCATAKARVSSAETQTPSRLCGRGRARQLVDDAQQFARWVARSRDLNSKARGEARLSMVSLMAAFNPGAEKRSAVTASLNR